MTYIAAVEIEEYCRQVILTRQAEGHLEKFPIWDDIKTFDGRPFRGVVDVLTGGFPCQDISSAGRGVGIAGERSGLWFEYLRLIEEIGPRFVFAENVPALRTRGLGTVISGLAELGYDVRWCLLGAWHVGAPHRRNRIWVLAVRREESPCADTDSIGSHRAGVDQHGEAELRDQQVSESGSLGREDRKSVV